MNIYVYVMLHRGGYDWSRNELKVYHIWKCFGLAMNVLSEGKYTFLVWWAVTEKTDKDVFVF